MFTKINSSIELICAFVKVNSFMLKIACKQFIKIEVNNYIRRVFNNLQATKNNQNFHAIKPFYKTAHNFSATQSLSIQPKTLIFIFLQKS